MRVSNWKEEQVSSKPNYLAACNRGNGDLLKTLITMAMELGPDCFVAQSLALHDRSDQSASLKRYLRPTLILCGAEDTLCQVSRHAEMLQLCQHGHLSIISDAGHITKMEQLLETNSAIARWLNDWA